MILTYLRHFYDRRQATTIGIGVFAGMFFAIIASNLFLSGVAYGIHTYQEYRFEQRTAANRKTLPPATMPDPEVNAQPGAPR